MAPARKTKATQKLLDQINALFPKRSKASDGWIGDKKHSHRKSDHNPEADGTVDAVDITHDPVNGPNIARLGAVLMASKDRRISYVIFNGQIFAGSGGVQPWKLRKYTGANKHTKHLHISVNDKFQDDASEWDLAELDH